MNWLGAVRYSVLSKLWTDSWVRDDTSKKVLCLATIKSGEEQRASKSNKNVHNYSWDWKYIHFQYSNGVSLTQRKLSIIWPGHEPNKHFPKKGSDYIPLGSWRRPVQVRWSKHLLFPWDRSVQRTIPWVLLLSIQITIYTFYICLFSTYVPFFF